MPEHQALKSLAERWTGAKAAERANAQSYIIEMCDALGVERPRPAGAGYEFEFPVRVVGRDGSEAQNFADLYKQGHLLLEAKDADDKTGSDLLLRRAFGQVRTYAAHVPGGAAPPYLLVLDVGKTLMVWDRWTGSFGGFAACARRIDLRTLHQRPDDIELLRDIWTNPGARDPRVRAQAVTTEIAGKLARLAASLEARGHPQEHVARFLMRCVFSMFAEDVGLLPREAFRMTVQNAGLEGGPERLAQALAGLWKAMDAGELFGAEKILRFNGAFFSDADVLLLEREDIALLLEAACADWRDVEPTIFGTLLVRALDPEERHRLGAEYTPRAFIERLVRPTVEEPIRERWTAVQAEVLQLRSSGKAKDRTAAERRLREFHAWMRGLRFLDPACGSGNFLYVTMHMVKEIELEVIGELAEVTGSGELRFHEVDPSQFFGLEVKPWAREIAELVLWIGFHQYWKRHHSVQPPEPVLQDTGTLQCRDAVLRWDHAEHIPNRDRPDPTPRIQSPVTGELIPDPTATIQYMAHLGARQAEWPEADFIIGNPPYLGSKRMLALLGDGYVDALREAYGNVPDAADYVMYWWQRAAEAVGSGRTIRAGLITTNSITQRQNRAVISAASAFGVRVIWAIADHVWYDSSDDAAVRVAMTVLSAEARPARLLTVENVGRVRGEVPVVNEVHAPKLNDDLTTHADVATAAGQPLRANAGLMSFGFMLNGAGFILKEKEADALLAADRSHADIIRRYRNGRDLAQRPRGVSLIDFGLRSEDEAKLYPVLFDIVKARVKPDRDAARRPGVRDRWWRFAEARPSLRSALAGLKRYIGTVETSRHRFFVFLEGDIAPDHMVIALASDDAFHLGVLSSSLHSTWALAAGGKMGVGNTPRYNKGPCFEAFPFPNAAPQLRHDIATAAEKIDAHRVSATRRHERVTITAMYSVVEKLRTGEKLDEKEQLVHDLGACETLRDLHDSLDRLVATAYGWSWPAAPSVVIERLVQLHDQRISEERSGTIHWLRPSYQARLFQGEEAGTGAVELPLAAAATGGRAQSAPVGAWPADAIGQITALRDMVISSAISVGEISSRFRGAKPDIVQRHLDTLAILGEAQRLPDGRYTAFAPAT